MWHSPGEMMSPWSGRAAAAAGGGGVGIYKYKPIRKSSPAQAEARYMYLYIWQKGDTPSKRGSLCTKLPWFIRSVHCVTWVFIRTEERPDAVFRKRKVR